MPHLTDVAVDTGGTFTDFVILDQGRLALHKVPSRPGNPTLAVESGLSDLNLQPSAVRLVHGTTVATNALLERKGARLFLVTEAGFEDVLRIGRQNRDHLYDLRVTRPEPLFAAGHVLGVPRSAPRPGAEPELDPDFLQNTLLPALRQAGPELVCVCLLDSYENPEDELAIKKYLESHDFRVVTSHEVLPEFREFERFSTTMLNAYVAPIMTRYIHELDGNLGLANLQIMQSNGGTLSAKSIGREAIHTLLSGPAGGVVGAQAVAAHMGYDQLITFDMGGTSTDVSLLPGNIQYTTDTYFHGWPARIPMINIHTVGAGGGSIAWMDAGGLLKVGPRSAGADPGPACYGRGQDLTVTDANVFLGRIPPSRFLGGRMALRTECITPILHDLAKACGKSPEETAEGIITIANQHMLRALRVISIQRGFNPADFVLVTFGGAGALHAAALARELGIRRVLIPPCAGVLSALGLLMAEVIKNFQVPVFKSFPAEAVSISPDELLDHLRRLEERAAAEMAPEGFQPGDLRLIPSVDMRYQGQSWEVNIPYRPETVGSDFRRRHDELYGYVPSGRGWEIVNLRVQAVGVRSHPDLSRLATERRHKTLAPLETRSVIHHGRKLDTPCYQWEDLPLDSEVQGPAIILDNFTTVWVPPGYQSAINAIGGLELWSA